MWAAIGELLFTVVVGYMGAIELLFVAKQLYHLTFQHQHRQMLLLDDNNLRRLQDQVEREIEEAARNETLGFNAMKDGVLYKDGFRIDPDEINEHEISQRQVIGGSKTSLEREDRGSSEDAARKSERLPSESERREEVVEEPCIKKHVDRVASGRPVGVEDATSADDNRTNAARSIKTQISQTNTEDYSLSSRRTDDSGLSPVISGEVRRSKSPTIQVSPPLAPQELSPLSPEMRFGEYEREEPEGQDVPEPQYSDEYLRSLDGIKIRPLIRDDGSGRRRAFKKRRSSESTSSRESRASREEELKMFTSLEEEEFASIRRGDSDYVPIRYSSDPNLIKGGKHQRRHKKSPMKDSSAGETETEEGKGSLEMLHEEGTSPWGDVKPEHYKESEFWRREKAVSIEEENEENTQTWSETIQKEQAGQVMASPSPTKNIPKLSSFEQATPFQHDSVVSNLSAEKNQDKDKKSTGVEDVENVSSDAVSQAELLLSSQGVKPSAVTEDINACETPDNKTDQTGLRRSPRLDDIDHYEEHLRALSPPAQSPQNNDLSNSQLTDITPASSIDEQNFSAVAHNIDEISSCLGSETLQGLAPQKLDQPKTPVIEIEPTSDDSNSNANQSTGDVGIASESGLLEGISDFYDFNASINPSRSPSIERGTSKSRSSSRLNSRAASKERHAQAAESSPTPTRPEDDNMEGISDFYDFCTKMNQHLYGHQDKRAHGGHRSTTDYLAEKLNEKKPRSKSPLPPIMTSKNEDTGLPQESGGTGGSKETPSIPETPEYKRTLSANMRYVESMREEYINNMYKRSRYVGESMDFENDFEELRERMRHFRRSQSKSRSPLPDEEQPSTSKQAALVQARRELQERILEEITRTTINYQDFSRDFNKSYMDFDRRGSDSALIQRPELMIQIEDQCKKQDFYDDDTDDMLEGEEYHHFRRFSLGQEHQIEEYPSDDYMYMEQVDIRTKTGTRSWTRKDYRGNDDQFNLEANDEVSSSAMDTTEDDSDRAEADDIDTESEDDRQTVVEVDDEIDEDVWDYERPEESNEQSECEEAEREMDRYADKNARDWYEDGAAGGIDKTTDDVQLITDDSINIEEMYDDAVRNREESKIQRDYDTIVMAMNEEEGKKVKSPAELCDASSVRTEELLDEILREDAAAYKHLSPRRDKIEASRNFIEREANAVSFQNGATSASISSTRLRSRYGIGPSPAFRNFDNVEDVNVDLNYKPKKEYKWRKNFKLDDEEETSKDFEMEDRNGSSSPNAFRLEEETENRGHPFPEVADESQSLEDTQRLTITEENAADQIDSKEDTGASEQIAEVVSQDFSKHKGANIEPGNYEEGEKISKKKKTKRRNRKGSRGSIGSDDQQLEPVLQNQLTDNSGSQLETGAKKKIKKKKKTSDASDPLSPLKSSSPTTVDTLKSANDLNSMVTSTSSVKIVETPEPSAIDKLRNSPTCLVPTPAPAKSKSRSPDPATKSTSPKPQLERNDSTGVYDLIKDGSMYPWF